MQSQAEHCFVANWREATAAVLRYSALASYDMIGAKPSVFLVRPQHTDETASGCSRDYERDVIADDNIIR